MSLKRNLIHWVGLVCITCRLLTPVMAAENDLIDTVDSSLTKQNISLTAQEQAWIKAHPQVNVAVKSGWMPIEFKLESGHFRGISIDYLDLTAQLTGLHFKLQAYPETAADWARIGVVSSVNVKTHRLAGFTPIAQPHLNMPIAIYIHKEQTALLPLMDKVDAIKQYRVAVFKHGGLAQALLAQYPEMRLVYVELADEAFAKLKNHEVDAYVGNETIVDYHIAYHRLDYVAKLGQMPIKATVSMAVNDQSPELTSIMQKALQVIGSNRPEIVEAWQPEDHTPGMWVWLSIAALVLLLLYGSYKLYQTYLRFKQIEKANQQKIWHQANYDYLTDLPNRYYFQQRLEQAIQLAAAQQTQVGLITIDLDGFKDINDTAGHSVGDKLLVMVAERIRHCIGKEEIPARQGGDEFFVLVPDAVDLASLEVIANAILYQLQQPFGIDLKQFYISASIGIAIYPETCDNAESLIIHADHAMFEAKRAGKNHYQFFSRAMLTEANARFSLIYDLREAIKQQAFYMDYQPIFNMKTGELIKAEALLRWKHPTRGQVGPNIFIPLAEESGFMLELGKQVFAIMLQDLARIQAHFGSTLIISINVSPLQFSYPSAILDFIAATQQRQLDGHCICFEITEGLFLKPTPTVDHTIKAIRDAGIQLAIDDFGTGYSVFGYLKKYPVECLKIDKSFVKNLGSNLYDYILCKSIIQMAHQMNIQVVAEGVENAEQKDTLTVLECDYLQGYLMARPAPLTQLLSLSTLQS